MMDHTVKFNLGDTVYYRVKPEIPGVVTGILFRPHGGVCYLVTWSHDLTERYNYEIELTTEPNLAAP